MTKSVDHLTRHYSQELSRAVVWLLGAGGGVPGGGESGRKERIRVEEVLELSGGVGRALDEVGGALRYTYFLLLAACHVEFLHPG